MTRENETYIHPLADAQIGAADISILIHYPIPPHRQPAYAAEQFWSGVFPLANRLADEVPSLPMGPHQDVTQTTAVILGVRAAMVRAV